MPTKRTRPQQHLTIGNLSDAQRDHLRANGGGNLTEGIRRLLDQAQENPKWEYTTVVMPTPGTRFDDFQRMNELGSEGWELVALNPAQGHTWATFKRRVVTPDARETKENAK